MKEIRESGDIDLILNFGNNHKCQVIAMPIIQFIIDDCKCSNLLCITKGGHSLNMNGLYCFVMVFYPIAFLSTFVELTSFFTFADNFRTHYRELVNTNVDNYRHYKIFKHWCIYCWLPNILIWPGASWWWSHKLIRH